MFIIWCRKSTCCIHVHYMMYEIHVLYTCSLYDVGNPRVVYMFIIWCRKSTCCIHVHYMMLEIHVLYTCSLYDVGNPRIVYMFIIWCRKSTCCIHVHYISKIWSNFKDVLKIIGNLVFMYIVFKKIWSNFKDDGNISLLGYKKVFFSLPTGPIGLSHKISVEMFEIHFRNQETVWM
jgi:hypothetical protein